MQRTKAITFRVNEKELAKIRLFCKHNEMKLSAYCRATALGELNTFHISEELMQKIVSENIEVLAEKMGYKITKPK